MTAYKAFLLFSTFALFILSSVEASSDLGLFHIERNKNKNQVHYTLSVDKNCKINKRKPVEGYWLLLEEGKNKTESIGAFEKAAYGVRGQKVKNNSTEVDFHLQPVKKYKITASIENKNGKCSALTTTFIRGEKVLLKKVYVHADESGFTPSVDYIIVHGLGLESKKPVEEKVVP